jgi:CRP/FNR family transcriptional activator FtrB
MRGFDTGVFRSVRLFADIEEGYFQALIEAALVQHFPPRTLLMKESEDADFLHILLDGAVELFTEIDQEQTRIAVFEPVATFLLPAVIAGLPCPASARTLKAARILMIQAEAVRNAFEADPAFARAVVCEFSRSFRGLLAGLKNQKLRTRTERVADWLLRANAQG